MSLLSQETINRVLSAPLPDLTQIRTTEAVVPRRAASLLEHLLVEPKITCPDWHLQVAEAFLRVGQASGALEHSRASMKLNAESRSLDMLPRSWFIQSLALMSQGIYGGARQLVEQMESVALGLGDAKALGLFHEANGWLLLKSGSLVSGEYSQALESFEKALEVWIGEDIASNQITAMDGIANVLVLLGKPFESLETVDSGLRLAAEANDWRFVHRLLLHRAIALRDQGYRQQSEEAFQLTLDWCAYEGDDYCRTRTLIGLGQLYGVSSDARYYRAEPTFLAAIDLADRIGAPVLRMEGHMGLADYLLQDNQPDRAQEEQARAAQIAERVANEGTRRFLELRENERRQRDEARRQRFERRMREAFESSLDAIFVFDARRGSDGSVIDLVNEVRNTAATNLVESTPASARLLSELAHHPVFNGITEPIRTVVESNVPYDDETIAILRGEQRWFARRVVPMTDGAALTIRDISDRKTAETALREAAEKATRADHAKTEFLAHMSHEVRTPISGVLGLAKLLSDTRLTDSQRTYVEGIISSTDILMSVIGDLLDLAKIEAGKLTVESTTVNVRKLVEDAAKLFRTQAEAKNLEFVVDIEDALPPYILIDGTRLRQIVFNLLSNALKFTQEGSISIRVYPRDQRFRVEVKDTGIGIPQEKQGAVFEAFEQVAQASSQGTGLGLAISRELVGLMGGQIGVVSEPGKGSLFWVDLPLNEVLGSKPNLPSHVHPVEKKFEGKRVLLVEDNRFNALVAKTLLSKLGFTVVLANDGAEAISKAKERYDAILMDVRLPSMDGLEATRQIRLEEGRNDRRTPIIAVTAAALTSEREDCLAAGMDEYLGKPFTLESLRSTMERWVH
jgi:signal transduction histidine kinase